MAGSIAVDMISYRTLPVLIVACSDRGQRPHHHVQRQGDAPPVVIRVLLVVLV
jgi:hypothetical protein